MSQQIFAAPAFDAPGNMYISQRFTTSNAFQGRPITHTADTQYIYQTRAELEQEDPLNLNILISGGKETNQDSLSNGE